MIKDFKGKMEEDAFRRVRQEGITWDKVSSREAWL